MESLLVIHRDKIASLFPRNFDSVISTLFDDRSVVLGPERRLCLSDLGERIFNIKAGENNRRLQRDFDKNIETLSPNSSIKPLPEVLIVSDTTNSFHSIYEQALENLDTTIEPPLNKLERQALASALLGTLADV